MKTMVLYLALVLAAFTGSAAAENYPSRPITLIIPGPAGGPGDPAGRVLIERMKTTLGQSLVMENIAAPTAPSPPRAPWPVIGASGAKPE